MKSARIRQTRILMLGLAYGRLVAYMYAMAGGLAPARAAPLRGLFEEQAYEVENVAKFAEMQIYGPKRASIDIGIGRFVHLTRPHPNAPSVAVVGTDGGRVVVIELSPAKPPSIVYQADDPMPARVWAVCAYWNDDTHMTLFVATSDRMLPRRMLPGMWATASQVRPETSTPRIRLRSTWWATIESQVPLSGSSPTQQGHRTLQSHASSRVPSSR